MKVLEVLVSAFARHAQASGNGAFTKRQECADQPRLCVFPNGLGKQGLKLYDEGNSSAGSVGIMKTLVEKKSSGTYAACRSYFKDHKWIKSS